MPLSLTSLEADIMAMEADLPQTVLFRGTSFSACVGELATGGQLSAEGFEDSADVEVVLRKSLLTAVSEADPKPNERIIWEQPAKQLRIAQVLASPDLLAWRLMCVDLTK